MRASHPSVGGEVLAEAGNDRVHLTLGATGFVDGGADTDTLELEGSADLVQNTQIVNFEAYVLGGGTYVIDLALISSGIITGGSGTLQTRDAALVMRGWTAADTAHSKRRKNPTSRWTTSSCASGSAFSSG